MSPLKPLIYFQPKMRQTLATLEEKWADFEDLETFESDIVEVTGEDIVAKINDVSGESQDDGFETPSHDDERGIVSLVSVDSNVDEDFDSVMDSPEALQDMRCYVNFIETDVLPLYTRFGGHERGQGQGRRPLVSVPAR